MWASGIELKPSGFHGKHLYTQSHLVGLQISILCQYLSLDPSWEVAIILFWGLCWIPLTVRSRYGSTYLQFQRSREPEGSWLRGHFVLHIEFQARLGYIMRFFLKNKQAVGRWWCMPLIPAFCWWRQVDLCRFKASLIYRVSPRIGSIATEKPCLENHVNSKAYKTKTKQSWNNSGSPHHLTRSAVG